jgi:hypothetical protein
MSRSDSVSSQLHDSEKLKLLHLFLWSCSIFWYKYVELVSRNMKTRSGCLRPTVTDKRANHYTRLIFLPLLFRACFPTSRLFPNLTATRFTHAATESRLLTNDSMDLPPESNLSDSFSLSCKPSYSSLRCR